MRGRCFIVGAGQVTSRGLRPGPKDLLLAADGGVDSLRAFGLRPDLLVGDFDSATSVPAGIPRLQFPVRKDDTDLSLCLKLGWQRGYRDFRLYGVSGGPREDHFLAALQLMAGYSLRGARLQLVAPRFTVDALTDGRLVLPTRPGRTLSVFSAFAEALGVELQGLSYEADSLHLTNRFPLGVSNQTVASRAVVSVKKGTLLIYRQR